MMRRLRQADSSSRSKSTPARLPVFESEPESTESPTPRSIRKRQRAHSPSHVENRRPWLSQYIAHSDSPWTLQPFVEGILFWIVYVVILGCCCWSCLGQGQERPFAGAYTVFPILFTVVFISVVFFGSRVMNQFSPIEARMNEYMLSYNVFQLLLNAFLVVAIFYEAYRHSLWGWGNRVDEGHGHLPLYIWIHYQTQYLEVLDTMFLVCRKKFSKISWLHVYLRVVFVWSWFLVVRLGCGGDSYFPAIAQSFVRFWVYGIYVLALSGRSVSPFVKSRITNLHYLQFGACAVQAIYVLYQRNMHPVLGATQLIVMVIALLLFANYHYQYDAQPNKLFKPANRLIFSFDSSGWLFLYHLGVAQYIQKVILPTIQAKDIAFSGASGGALVACALASDICITELKNHIVAQRHKCAPCFWRVMRIAEDTVEQFLPADAALSCRYRLRVLSTRVTVKPPFMMAEVTSDFKNRDYLKKILRASYHIPLLGGLFPYNTGSGYYLDGLFWSNTFMVPWRHFRTDDALVKVSALGTPGAHIRSQYKIPPWWAFFPPPEDALEGLFSIGYYDAEKYFEGKSAETEDKQRRSIEFLKRSPIDCIYVADEQWKKFFAVIFIIVGILTVAIDHVISIYGV